MKESCKGFFTYIWSIILFLLCFFFKNQEDPQKKNIEDSDKIRTIMLDEFALYNLFFDIHKIKKTLLKNRLIELQQMNIEYEEFFEEIQCVTKY